MSATSKGGRVGDDDLRAIARYYLARALYRTGEFSKALEVIAEADKWIASSQPIAGGLIKMVASWILFSNVGVEEAERALHAAKAMLWSRDYLEDANMVSLEGRFARQKGDFDAAIARAREAIGILDANSASEHANAVRCHVHLAFAQMLKARADGALSKLEERSALQVQILETLKEAEKICRQHDYPRVLDRVLYFRAMWLLMLGKDDAARVQAVKAHEAAEGCHDHVVMAHALIVQCQCARRCHDGNAARRLAREAQIVAEKTDNRRVKIRALIWRAFVESDPPTFNTTVAEELKDEAGCALRDSDGDYLRSEFEELAAHIANIRCQLGEEQLEFPRTVDDVLRVGKLDAVLDDIAQKIIRAVHRRIGTTQGTAVALDITRDRVKRKCPSLKQ
jgi:tetratricopeptide (TPR) repeat protein